jgi:hypothetical protein
MSEAPYVLDGLHHHAHQTDLRIAEHYRIMQARPFMRLWSGYHAVTHSLVPAIGG